jgi:polyhydroxyalkanoate synthase
LSMFDFFKAGEIMARIGKPPNTARTPSEVIYRQNKLKVLHYFPTTKTVLPTPVLIVSSLVNKYYILDLMPGRSFVEYLTAQGFGVYLVDWGTPDDGDSKTTLEDYLDGYLANAISRTLKYAKAKKVSLVGYCMGGTMALLYAALHPTKIKNLVLLATPVDFHNNSLLSIWARREYFDVDKFIDTYGNAPAEVLQNSFAMMKPTKNITRYADLMANAGDEEFVETFLAFDYWVNDAVPVAGETFRKFIKDTYQENLLVKDEMKLGAVRIELKNISSPLFNIVAEHDNIVPPESSTCLMNLVGSHDKELLQVKGGHHGLSIGPSALQTVWPRTADWLRASGKAGEKAPEVR